MSSAADGAHEEVTMDLARPTMSTHLAELVRRRLPGHSLEAPFYTSMDFFHLDMAAIFARHWLFSATEAEIPDPGDYVVVDIGPYSVIILRDDDEQIRALHNVCRHRGSRLLTDGSGSVGNIVCPYHQWTYRTDGCLVYAPQQDPALDKSRFGLRPIKVTAVAGLIFTCLDDDAPDDFAEVALFLEPYLRPYELARTKIAHQVDLPEDGNWKLVIENNRECQHCDSSHPELVSAYFPFFGYSETDIAPRLRPVFDRYESALAALDEVRAAHDFPRADRRELASRATGFQLSHPPLDGAGISFGPNGSQVCSKLLGSLTTAEFGDLSLHLQPNAWFHFLSDHAVVFRVLPVSADRSVVRTTWLVPSDAVPGVDYDIDTLTQVWQATNQQDAGLVANTQAGVSDPSYRPGPYSVVEDHVEGFVSWYTSRLAQYLDGPGPG